MTIKLTSRDIGLLKDIAQNVFLSFYQIKDEHFKMNAHPTVYNRLSKLMREGLIMSLPVNLPSSYLQDKSVGVIYYLAPKGAEVIHQFDENLPLRGSPVNINHSTILHDLILTDALRVLKKKHSGFKVINTKAAGMYPRGKRQVPDAILADTQTQKSMAVELELTAKSFSRYRDIIFNYRCHTRFEKVIYIVANDAIKKKICSISGDGSDEFNLQTRSNAMFLFYHLRSLLSDDFLPKPGKVKEVIL